MAPHRNETGRSDAPTSSGPTKDNFLDRDDCQFNFECSDFADICQPLPATFKVTCPHCSTFHPKKQHTAARCLVEQAKQRVDQAADDDAYGIHFAILMAVWPLAFADEMEASL